MDFPNWFQDLALVVSSHFLFPFLYFYSFLLLVYLYLNALYNLRSSRSFDIYEPPPLFTFNNFLSLNVPSPFSCFIGILGISGLLELLDGFYFRPKTADLFPFIIIIIIFLGGMLVLLVKFYYIVPKTADLLFLGRDDDYKRSVISSLSDVTADDFQRSVISSISAVTEIIGGMETAPYSRVSIIEKIRFNLSDFGELRTASRLWKDYCAKRDAVVYVVNAVTGRNMEQFSEAREDLNNLVNDEDFENVPFLIICITADPSASEEDLCTLLGLTNMTTGRGRVNLAGRNARPLEVFVAERLNRRKYLDAIRWLSQYIK